MHASLRDKHTKSGRCSSRKTIVTDRVLQLFLKVFECVCPLLLASFLLLESRAVIGDHVHAEYTIDVTGATNPTVGSVGVQTIGLPSGAMIRTPVDLDATKSSSSLLPDNWAFHWIVPAGTPNDVYTVNIIWSYPGM